MKIEVFIPGAGRPAARELEAPAGCTVREALELCGWREPAGEAGKWGYGVYGEPVGLDDALREGDRLEVCAPLQVAPVEARRLREREQRGKRP